MDIDGLVVGHKNIYVVETWYFARRVMCEGVCFPNNVFVK